MDNIKSISIFTSYFLAILICIIIIVRSILEPFRMTKRNGANKPTTNTLRSQVTLFILLTLTALAFTWYHMIRFFHISYITWSTTIASTDTPRTIGYWLRDTKLFEEAYRIVVITPERWWWSQQIFLACFGWGIWVSYQGHGGKPGRGGKGRKRGVLMAYMVLAQLVSLSVAVNLHFVDILTHRGAEVSTQRALVQPTEQKKKGKRETGATESGVAKVLLGIYLTLCFIPTSVLPTLTHTPPTSSLNKLFFPTLLLPHVALFIPIFFTYPVSPRFTRILFTSSTFGSVACHAGSTLAVAERVTVFLEQGKALASGAAAVQADPYEIFKTTVEWLGDTLMRTHPAVSSVSWDVVWFCASVAVWAGVEGGAGGIWVGGGEDKVRERNRVGLVRRVLRVLAAGLVMTVGGAGAGALVFAADL